MRTGTRRGRVAARPRVVTFALCLGLGCQYSSAQDSAVTVDIARCTALESAEARVACFGAEVDAALQERATAADVRSAAGEGDDAAATRAGRRDDGETRSSPRAQRPEREPQRDRDDGPPAAAPIEDAAEGEYFGTVVAIRERLPNAYVITLDNGQVWQQIVPQQYPLRPGLQVRIYPTGWGNNYRLNGLGTGTHIQVRQVR